MKLAFLLVLVLLSGPAFASGNLTATGLQTSYYANTNVTFPVWNITLNATVGSVSISGLNITLGRNFSDVMQVYVINSSGVIGSSLAASSAVPINASINLTTASNATIQIAVFVNASSALHDNITLNLSAVAVDQGSNATIAASNVSVLVDDVHATASVTPLYADTNVSDQQFIYTLVPTGREAFNNISIAIPAQYAITAVNEVRHGGSFLKNSTTLIDNALTVAFNQTSGKIDVNYTTGFMLPVVINFTANTSSSAVPAAQFNSTLTGSNLRLVNSDVIGTNTTVSTIHLLNVTSVIASKSAALANGTDYWEFNMTLLFNANVSGSVQFKLTDWTNNAGQTMSLTNGTLNYSTLLDSSNASTYINVTNGYDQQLSVQNCCNSLSSYNILLQMVIPGGTPSSSSWGAAYGILFRSV